MLQPAGAEPLKKVTQCYSLGKLRFVEVLGIDLAALLLQLPVVVLDRYFVTIGSVRIVVLIG